MKTAFQLGALLAIVPLLAYGNPHPTKGLHCKPVWTGSLNVVRRSLPGQSTPVKIGKDVDEFGQHSLVYDASKSDQKTQFTFSQCRVRGWDNDNDGWYGVIQPGSSKKFNPKGNCVTATISEDKHRLYVAKCAKNKHDASLEVQWFNTNADNILHKDLITAELIGGPDGKRKYPNVDFADFTKEPIVSVTSDNVDNVLAFADNHFY